MTVANCSDRVDPSGDLWRSWLVIPAIASRQNACVVHRADHDRNTRLRAFRQQIVERVLFEEGIPTCQKEGVPVAPFHRLQQRLPLVDADPDRSYQAVTAQFLKRSVSSVAKRPHHLGMRFLMLPHS